MAFRRIGEEIMTMATTPSLVKASRSKSSLGMRVRIHCGADQIGGSCVEVEFGGQRLVLDVGRPLSAPHDAFVPLPAVPGLGDGDPAIRAVLVSHGHQDHWGLIDQVHRSIPRYIGKGAADILRAAQFWGTGVDMRETGHFQDRVPLTFGPFTVTPYLVDHSGFDAYALVVEAGGQRLMYSGDIRGHGRKSALFDRMVDQPPLGIDALLLEGTHMGHGTDVHGLRSESEVEDAIAKQCDQTPGAVVVLNSAQNIDRLVTCYRAALRSNRVLAMDLYTADVVASTHRASLPQPGSGWPRVKVLVPMRQRVRVRNAAEFNRVEQIREHRIYPEQVSRDPSSYLIVGAHQGEVPRMIRTGVLQRGCVIWSLWGGYLEGPSGARLTESLRVAGVPLVQLHTSGHANLTDLQRLVDAINPSVVVPIHTEHPDAYQRALNGPVSVHGDGQWWNVGARAATNRETARNRGHGGSNDEN